MLAICLTHASLNVLLVGIIRGVLVSNAWQSLSCLRWISINTKYFFILGWNFFSFNSLVLVKSILRCWMRLRGIMVVGRVKSLPSLLSLVGLRGRSTTMGLKTARTEQAAVRNFGQWVLLDPAMSRVWWRWIL